MELPDFIYLYAKLYHSNCVKTVLAVENWLDKDDDEAYPKYVQDYKQYRDNFLHLDNVNVENILKRAAKKRTEETYSFLLDRTIETISNKKINDLAHKEYIKYEEQIKDRVSKFKKDDFKFEYLLELRKIEEEFYRRKK